MHPPRWLPHYTKYAFGSFPVSSCSAHHRHHNKTTAMAPLTVGIERLASLTVATRTGQKRKDGALLDGIRVIFRSCGRIRTVLWGKRTLLYGELLEKLYAESITNDIMRI